MIACWIELKYVFKLVLLFSLCLKFLKVLWNFIFDCILFFFCCCRYKNNFCSRFFSSFFKILFSLIFLFDIYLFNFDCCISNFLLSNFFIFIFLTFSSFGLFWNTIFFLFSSSWLLYIVSNIISKSLGVWLVWSDGWYINSVLLLVLLLLFLIKRDESLFLLTKSLSLIVLLNLYFLSRRTGFGLYWDSFWEFNNFSILSLSVSNFLIWFELFSFSWFEI